MGREYSKVTRLLEDSESWSTAAWLAYQEDQLRHRLEYCQSYVPYYQRIFREYDVSPKANDIVAELEKIPVIDKQGVRDNFKDLHSIKIGKSSTYAASTGGTTGKPLSITYDSRSYHREWAFKMFFWSLAIGYSIRNRKATFRGVTDGKRTWVENPIYNEVRFSPFHLDETNIGGILDKLSDYRPEYLHGYPSAIDRLAWFCKRQGVTIPSVRGIILISENFTKDQKNRIENTFDAPAYSFYGHSERLIFASMCNKLTDAMHVHPAYGYTEILDAQDRPIKSNGKFGELVGTGFLNDAMVLLRYRTGDYACWKEQCTCGRDMPCIGQIRGRWKQEHLVGSQGQKVSLTALNVHNSIYDNVAQMQYFQPSRGNVQIRIIPEEGYAERDADLIGQEFDSKLGEGFSVEIVIVEHLQKTQAGKTPFLIQTFA